MWIFFARLDYLNLLMLGWTELFSSSSKWKVSIFFFSTTFRVSTVFTMVSGWWGMTTISLIWSTTRSHAIAWILEIRITVRLEETICLQIFSSYFISLFIFQNELVDYVALILKSYKDLPFHFLSRSIVKVMATIAHFISDSNHG